MTGGFAAAAHHDPIAGPIGSLEVPLGPAQSPSTTSFCSRLPYQCRGLLSYSRHRPCFYCGRAALPACEGLRLSLRSLCSSSSSGGLLRCSLSRGPSHTAVLAPWSRGFVRIPRAWLPSSISVGISRAATSANWVTCASGSNAYRALGLSSSSEAFRVPLCSPRFAFCTPRLARLLPLVRRLRLCCLCSL